MFDIPKMVRALDRAALQTQEWPLALEDCRAEFSAKLFSVLRIYDDDADLLGSPERTEAHLDAYRAGQWYGRDPRAAAVARLAPGRITTDAKLVPANVRTNADFYRDFTVREDVPHMAVWRAGDAGSASLFVSILFDAAHGPLRPQEHSALAALQEHTISAFALSQAVTRARERGTLDGLSLVDTPAFGLDGDGRVTDETAAGSAALREYFDLDGDGRLTSRAPETAAALSRLLCSLGSRVLPDAALKSFHLTSPTGSRAVATPIVVHGAARDVFRHTRAIVLVRQLDRPKSTNAKILQALYSLTPAEIFVATRIAAGDAPAQIAIERDVSTATVRTILRNVFRKAGVNRQSELAALLAQLGC